MVRSGPDKRERLITAAADRFHRCGLARSTLADVAKQAGIAPGNVFYYFKTKEELAAAVLQRWRDTVVELIDEQSTEPDPWQRIACFIHQADRFRAIYADLGCPLTEIARDVRRGVAAQADAAATIHAVQFDWLIAQFCAAGFAGAVARRHACFLMATSHGSISLAHLQGDETLVSDAAASLSAWLENLQHEARMRA